MDRLVDSNIDPSFLDLLEDELPIVTFDDTPPDTMELIDNYDQCTSINLFNRRKKKSLNSSVQNPVTSTMAETNLLDKNSENSLVSPTNANSTILRRLLETPESKAAERVAKKAKKADNLEPEEDSEAKPLSSPSSKAKKAKSEKADDSSSECETASIASSTASLSRKRKRSMTDFPPKKKAKKESVLPAKKQPKSIKKSLQSPIVSKKLRQQQASPPNGRTSKNKNQQNLKSPKPKPKSVQLKLGMGKNGLSLKKPGKVTPVKPSLYGPKGGRRYLTKDDPDLFKPKKNDEIMPQKKKRGRPFSKDKNNQEVQKDSSKDPMSKTVEDEKQATHPDTDPDSNAEQDDDSEEKEGTAEDMPIKKRGRPFSKNKNPAVQKSPGAAVVVKKTSGNSLKGPMSKVGTEKAKKSKIVIPLIDISGGIEVPSDTDDDDIDDEDDINFRPNMGNTKKVGISGPGNRKRKSKKKKRSIIVKPKKVMIPCVTISDDSDEDDSEEDTAENTENSDDDENSVDVEATDDPDTDPNADQDDSSEALTLPVKKKRGRPFSKDKNLAAAVAKNSLKGPMSKIVEGKANPDTDPDSNAEQGDDSEDEEGTENSDDNSDDSENSADDEEEEEGATEDSDSEDKPIIVRNKKQFPATKLAKQLRMRQEQNMKEGQKNKNKLGKTKNKTRSSRKLRT